jgi:hypothetical protein
MSFKNPHPCFSCDFSLLIFYNKASFIENKIKPKRCSLFVQLGFKHKLSQLWTVSLTDI